MNLSHTTLLGTIIFTIGLIISSFFLSNEILDQHHRNFITANNNTLIDVIFLYNNCIIDTFPNILNNCNNEEIFIFEYTLQISMSENSSYQITYGDNSSCIINHMSNSFNNCYEILMGYEYKIHYDLYNHTLCHNSPENNDILALSSMTTCIYNNSNILYENCQSDILHKNKYITDTVFIILYGFNIILILLIIISIFILIKTSISILYHKKFHLIKNDQIEL